MLAKKFRLNLRARPQFTKVFTSPYFVLKVRGNDSLYNRYGFLVSKKIDSRSTARNRIKRIMRSCIEEMLEEIMVGYDMLLIFKKESLRVSKTNILKSIKTVFEREGLIK